MLRRRVSCPVFTSEKCELASNLPAECEFSAAEQENFLPLDQWNSPLIASSCRTNKVRADNAAHWQHTETIVQRLFSVSSGLTSQSKSKSSSFSIFQCHFGVGLEQLLTKSVVWSIMEQRFSLGTAWSNWSTTSITVIFLSVPDILLRIGSVGAKLLHPSQ